MGHASSAAAVMGEDSSNTPLGDRASPSAGAHAQADAQPDLSPSLVTQRHAGVAAFEWKFLVDETQALRIEEQLRSELLLDPHGDSRLGGGYAVTTIYFDTPDWDVLRGIGRHKLRKYRLRRYGDAPEFFLERKTKRGQKVRKRRDSIAADRLSRVNGDSRDALPDAPEWFARQLQRWRLRPACRIGYVRRAYYAVTPQGRLRLTFDRQLHGAPVDGWSLRVTRDEAPLLFDRVICEFKYVETMPTLFKKTIQDFQLAAAGFSKYRHGMRILGAGPPPRAPDETAGAGDA